ncbi:hypothetical protein OQA88_8397 [Cercophora sp. LCS_1]
MQPFVYQPLSQSDQIRVLKVSPATDGDTEISTTFEIQSLAKNAFPNFEALSYMWGDQTERATISLDGTPFSVSRHLQGTIKALRDTTEPRYLWIDAICINQTDIKERNQQVQLMRVIYQRAKTVLVWLDREVDPCLPAFQKLNTFTEKSELAELGEDPELWDPLCEVFKDPYWSRVWIQQEISNAASLRLFCRHVELRVYSVYHLLRLFYQIQLENILGFTWWDWALKKPSVTLPPRFGLIDSHLQPIKGTTLGGTDLDLIETLSKTCTLKCTDDRDRVYGIMFLAPGCRQGDIKVDYRLTLSEVYAEVVHCLIAKYRSTRFLLYTTLGRGTTPPPNPTIPTWVPDWRRPPPRPGMARSLPPLIIPPPSSRRSPFPKITSQTLTLLATKVDTVHTPYHALFATDLLSQTLTTFIQTCTQITTDALNLQNSINPTASPPANTPIHQSTPWTSLIQTLAAYSNQNLQKHPNLSEILTRGATELFDLSQQRDEDFNPDTCKLGKILNLPKDSDVLRFGRVFVSFAWWVLTKHRVPFLSGKGRIGLAPGCVKVGDGVWLVGGCEVPVVLRGVHVGNENGGNQDDENLEGKNDESKGGNKMEVVGEGYLDGENFWETIGGFKGVDEVYERNGFEVLDLV